MRRHLIIGAVVTMLAVPALAAGRAPTEITVAKDNTFTFTPKRVAKTVGRGAVHWRWGEDGTTQRSHNVRQDDRLFYSGTPTKSDPDGFTVVPSAGKFHYYCEPHWNPEYPEFGMQGMVKVKPAIFDKRVPSAHRDQLVHQEWSFGVRWSTGSYDTGDAFDVRYRRDGGRWKLWKNDVTTTQARFGANRRPIWVRPGHTYDIQARSIDKSDRNARSDWSPFARVRP